MIQPLEEEFETSKALDLRIALIHVAIKEMDDAQRFRLDRLLETQKNISKMLNWCALAALFYVVTAVVSYFR